MNPNTGTFISMDSYNGSINDPVSLHKYLYANANPVMYSDPSGYMSLSETMVTYTIIGALSGGMLNASMNVLRFISGDPSMTDKYDSPITAFIDGFLDGMIWGAFVGISAATFLIFGLWTAIAVAVNFGFSYYYYTLGKEAAAANDWPTAIYYLFLSVYSAAVAFTTVSVATDDMERAVEEYAENASASGDDNSTGNTQAGTTQNGSLDSLPQNAQDSYNAYEKSGWKNHSGQTPGTKAGKTFANDGRDGGTMLPKVNYDGNQINYREYDVNNRISGMPRDSERFVLGDDGSVYYTNDHYHNYIKIK